MYNLEDYIAKLKTLRVDRAHGGPAPHKPLLLLAVMDLIEKGQIKTSSVELTSDLAFRFLNYWEIVHARVGSVGKIVLPFYHLKSDGFWTLVPRAGMHKVIHTIKPKSASALNTIVECARLDEHFFEFCVNSETRALLRSALISAPYFTKSESTELASLAMLPYSDTVKKILSAFPKTTQTQSNRTRDIRFRVHIVPLYRHTCVLCGLRTITIDGATVVEAAHIREFADSRDDSVQKGFALCRNHHWAFDEGLWSVEDDWSIIVAHTNFDEEAPAGIQLKRYHGQLLRLNIDLQFRPDPKNFKWHRNHRFKSV